MSWVDVRERSPRIMWLHGPAGAGKSTIGQTTAERCNVEGKLIAAFFFSRTTAGRNTESRLFSTLAYQLALSVPDSRARIEDTIINDPTLLTRSLQTQVQRLIIDPLSSHHHRGTSAPHLIIIDGLDECENSNSAHARILQAIANALQRFDVSVCVLITSRPEEDIRNTFNADELCAISIRLALDDSFSPQKDIEVFLQSKFSELKRKHPVRSLSETQFIYASTVMHYISDVRHHPTKRLDIVLGIAPRGDDRPFAQLDALYLHIFSCIPDLLGTSRVIGALLLKYSLETKSPAMIDKFLHLAPGDTYLLLSDLHSVLSIPDGSSSKTLIRLLHASLGDFLLDQSRSGEYFINVADVHADFAECCFRHCIRGRASRYPLDGARFAIQNASVVADLEEYLLGLPVSQLRMEYPWLSEEKLQQLWKAITQYLKKCDDQYSHIVAHMTNNVHLAIPGVEDEVHTTSNVHLAIPGVEDEVPSCFSCRWLRK
ncbi:hypothetical protein BDQ12DRAFT_723742 [Crucibulum laeve]|uniref:NACHT domain-containing protein n=1 Tax=Crucibulum laeve TaxID=68775 RepID=A0A5C3LXY7_9AGAR|nr:hypothetical protein BDQ12DRAFT_723742 [Crucibulum laeve]